MKCEFKKEFLYKKEQVVTGANYITYAWYLVKDGEGAAFHGGMFFERTLDKYTNKFGFIPCGIEGHHKKPLYEEQSFVKNCWVTNGKCYCDDSSLQAEEQLGWINPDGSDDEAIWDTLHIYYDAWIEKEND